MKEWSKDFQDFKENNDIHVSLKTRDDLFDFVQKDLNPSSQFIFGKLLIIQSTVGILTMIFCPQFELSLTNQHHVFHFFYHNLGKYPCLFICGMIFVGSGALVASYLLRRQELRIIQDSKLLYAMSISGIFVASFFMLGVKIYFNTSLVWFAGSTFAAVFMYSFNFKIRNKIFI